MAMNWDMIYNSCKVTAGQWGYSEPAIAKRVKEAATKIEYLWYKMINVDCIQENEIYIISIDDKNCETEDSSSNPVPSGTHRR